MDISSKFAKVESEIHTLQKNLLKDLHSLLKLNLSDTKEEGMTESKIKIKNFCSKDYNFSRYLHHLSSVIDDIKEIEEKSNMLPVVVEEMERLKNEREVSKEALLREGYNLRILMESSEAENQSIHREYKLTQDLFEELKNTIEDEENRLSRKEADINKLILEKNNLLQKQSTYKILTKKAEQDKENQINFVQSKYLELENQANEMERNFLNHMAEKEKLIEDLKRKTRLIEKEISLQKDLQSLKGSIN